MASELLPFKSSDRKIGISLNNFIAISVSRVPSFFYIYSITGDLLTSFQWDQSNIIVGNNDDHIIHISASHDLHRRCFLLLASEKGSVSLYTVKMNHQSMRRSSSSSEGKQFEISHYATISEPSSESTASTIVSANIIETSFFRVIAIAYNNGTLNLYDIVNVTSLLGQFVVPHPLVPITMVLKYGSSFIVGTEDGRIISVPYKSILFADNERTADSEENLSDNIFYCEPNLPNNVAARSGAFDLSSPSVLYVTDDDDVYVYYLSTKYCSLLHRIDIPLPSSSSNDNNNEITSKSKIITAPGHFLLANQQLNQLMLYNTSDIGGYELDDGNVNISPKETLSLSEDISSECRHYFNILGNKAQEVIIICDNKLSVFKGSLSHSNYINISSFRPIVILIVAFFILAFKFKGRTNTTGTATTTTTKNNNKYHQDMLRKLNPATLQYASITATNNNNNNNNFSDISHILDNLSPTLKQRHATTTTTATEDQL